MASKRGEEGWKEKEREHGREGKRIHAEMNKESSESVEQ